MEHITPAGVLLVLLFILPVFYNISRAKKGKKIFIRRIPGIDAIDEAIGRSVELGRPLSFTTGLVGIGPLLYACLGVLHYVGKKAAIYSARLFVPCNNAEVMVLCDATLQNAYRSAKRSSSYDPSYLRFLSEEQFAYAAGYMGLMHRENVGSAFLFGDFAAESLILAEAGQQVGAVQVAGTTAAAQVPFFLTSCDYTLIGEELYAAGALLSQDPVQTGSVRGQDLAKAGIALIIIAGVFLASYWSAYMHPEDASSVGEILNTTWEDIF